MTRVHRYRSALWITLAAFVCIVQGPGFVSSLRPDPREGLDFFQEWSSAKNWETGAPIYLDLDVAAERYLDRPRVPGERWLFARNAHPPGAVLLALPFAALSYQDGMLLWNVLSLAALGVSLLLIAQGVGLRPAPWMLFPSVVILLLANPLRQQVNHGQLNLVLLLLLVGAWSAERSSRGLTAGALVGAAAAIKLFPAFLLVYYGLRRQWKVVGSALVGFGLLTVLSAMILGLDAYRDYVEEVMPTVSGFRNVWVNASLGGFWAKWFGAGAIDPMSPGRGVMVAPLAARPAVEVAGLLVSALVVILLWVRAVLRLPASLTFGLSLTTMLLLSPVTWDHYFVLLLLPIVQLWLTFPEPRWERMALILVLVPMVLSPLLFVSGFVGPNRIVSLLGVSMHFFALTGLFVLGLRPPPSAIPASTRPK